jgi:predicted nucleic acid-binding Zn ribbon protein
VIKRVGDLLREYLKDRGWPAEDPFASIFLEWTKVAGDPIGEHSRPVEMEDGVLIVEVDHPGWMQILLLKKPSLLASIRERVPAMNVHDLRPRLRSMGAKRA